MSNSETETIQAAAPAVAPDGSKTPHTAALARRVAPGKAKSGKKTTPARKGATKPKGAKPAKVTKAKTGKKQSGPREASKTEKILALLRRPDGATHSRAGESKKMAGTFPSRIFVGNGQQEEGLTVTSVKPENGERRYSVKGA